MIPLTGILLGALLFALFGLLHPRCGPEGRCGACTGCAFHPESTDESR